MLKLIRAILEKHVQILEQELERAKQTNAEVNYVYEDYKRVAELTRYYPFGSSEVMALTEGCAEFLTTLGPRHTPQLVAFLKDNVTIDNYRKWQMKKA